MRRLMLPLTLGIVLSAIPSVATAATGVAFVDPDDGRWYVPDGSGSHVSFTFGDPYDTPISGDWDCDGIDSPGRVTGDGYFYLRNSTGSGDPDVAFHFGVRGDRPLVGDWNGDGCDTVAVYRPSDSTVYTADRLGTHVSWRAEPVVGAPVVADFDGDRRDDVAGYREGSGFVFVNDDVVPGPPISGDWFFDGRSIGFPGDYARTHALSGLTPVPGIYGGECPACTAGLPTLERGDTGAWVGDLRSALAARGFRPGEGHEYDDDLAAAVIAFEKYHGLARDGIFGSDHWEQLASAVAIPYRADTPTRVEVDLGRQILFLIVDHQPIGIIPVSSANGETYTSWDGTAATARTPEGEFSFYRQEDGWYRSYLGRLYEPFFFRGGYAIHGSNSVPVYPASHGCIRTRIVDQDWLKPRLEMGMPIFVYGQRTEAPAVVPVDSLEG